MNKSPLVSVGIPVYNGEKIIKKSLQSIFKQTHKNLEIIIIDDNSSDSSFEILKKITYRKKNTKLFKNKKNMGISYTYSRLVRLAKGKFFLWNPQDDSRSENYIQICLAEFSEDKNIVLCQGNVQVAYKNRIYHENRIDSYSGIKNDFERLKIFSRNFCDTTVYGLIDRHKLLKTNLFNQNSTAPANLLLQELILQGKFKQVDGCFFRYNATVFRMGPKQEYWRHNKQEIPLLHHPSLFIFYKNLIYILKSKIKSKIKILFYYLLLFAKTNGSKLLQKIFKKKTSSLVNLNPDITYKIKPSRKDLYYKRFFV